MSFQVSEIENVVIGAGIIGLAIARALSLAGREVLVLEKNDHIGEETSFRNSAVLHAGIYYPKKTLKAKFCQEGQALLYEYCKKNNIPFKKIGKLIVITDKTQHKKLNQLFNLAKTNVKSLVFLEKNEITSMESDLNAIAGVFSPLTGIINGRALLLSFKKDIEITKNLISCHTNFVNAEIKNKKFLINLLVRNKPKTIFCRHLFNAAGLFATSVARSIVGVRKESIPRQYFAKGNYFKLEGITPFKHLIYPLPEQAGLGIHSTISLDGYTRFGPDVEWVNQIDYKVSKNRANVFYQAIRTYYPRLSDDTLVPEFSGIRSKILPPEEQPQDFCIQDWKYHGIRNLINLYGIESPGLTSSMAIANYVISSLS